MQDNKSWLLRQIQIAKEEMEKLPEWEKQAIRQEVDRTIYSKRPKLEK